MKKLIFLNFILLSACNSKTGFSQIEWRSGDSPSSLQSLDKVEISSISKVMSSTQLVEIQQQTIHGIRIEDSYVKKIRNTNGEILIVRAAISLDEDKLAALLLSNFEVQKNTILDEIKNAFPIFRKKPPEKIEVSVLHHHKYYEPVWNVVYSDVHGIPWEMKLGSHLQIRSIKRLGSQFHDTPAFIFPRGPKLSDLQEVILKGLAADPTLSNDHLIVTSQAESKISDLSGPLKFLQTDARFDQLQAFYYLEESLKWFEKTLNVKLPFNIQAEVGIGFPEKTNSAFYYQGKIRFGLGDDQTYSHIPQDPSIVIHESVHALVDSIARLPYEGEGGSLNEAFADFFTAVQLDNPNMGEAAYLKGPYRRTLANDFKLAEKTDGLYHDSGIVSGALWDLRQKFGLEKSRQIGLLTLNRLTPGSDFADFGVQVKEVLSLVLSPEEVRIAAGLLEKRGF
jgi:Zn-dependent metalloprotease